MDRIVGGPSALGEHSPLPTHLAVVVLLLGRNSINPGIERIATGGFLRVGGGNSGLVAGFTAWYRTLHPRAPSVGGELKRWGGFAKQSGDAGTYEQQRDGLSLSVLLLP